MSGAVAVNTNGGHVSALPHMSRGSREVLSFIADCAQRGREAVVAEIYESLGRTQSTVNYQVLTLINTGMITVEKHGGGRAQTAALTPQAKRLLGIGLPLLGVLPGGDLIVEEAIEDFEGGPVWLERLSDVVPYVTGDYALRVRGNSMSGDGIMDGCRVYFHRVEPGQRVANGTIVHAEVPQSDGTHEVTLKRYFYDEGTNTVILRPSTPGYKTIECPADEVLIVGWAYHFDASLGGGLETASIFPQKQPRQKAAK